MPDTDRPTLHILNKAPAHSRSANCLQQLAAGDTLVLLEDGVLALQLVSRPPQGCVVFALRADALARGLTDEGSASRTQDANTDTAVPATWCDMDKLVQLTQDYERIINW